MPHSRSSRHAARGAQKGALLPFRGHHPCCTDSGRKESPCHRPTTCCTTPTPDPPCQGIHTLSGSLGIVPPYMARSILLLQYLQPHDATCCPRDTLECYCSPRPDLHGPPFPTPPQWASAHAHLGRSCLPHAIGKSAIRSKHSHRARSN